MTMEELWNKKQILRRLNEILENYTEGVTSMRDELEDLIAEIEAN